MPRGIPGKERTIYVSTGDRAHIHAILTAGVRLGGTVQATLQSVHREQRINPDRSFMTLPLVVHRYGTGHLGPRNSGRSGIGSVVHLRIIGIGILNELVTATALSHNNYGIIIADKRRILLKPTTGNRTQDKAPRRRYHLVALTRDDKLIGTGISGHEPVAVGKLKGKAVIGIREYSRIVGDAAGERSGKLHARISKSFEAVNGNVPVILPVHLCRSSHGFIGIDADVSYVAGIDGECQKTADIPKNSRGRYF